MSDFELMPEKDESYYDDLPYSPEELRERGFIATRKCVAWKWELRKISENEYGKGRNGGKR